MTEGKDENINGLIKTGSEIAGAAVGGALGFMAGGPTGAIVGGPAGVLIAKGLEAIGKELKQRFLGRREEVRIGAAIIFAANKVKENVDSGRAYRTDNFFAASVNERSSFEEVTEGVLLAAQREHEEKKVRFIGNLLGNIPFDQSISRADANLLVRVAESLSYRQLCLLRLFAVKESFQVKVGSYRDVKEFTRDQISVLQEIYDLYNMSLVNCSGEALLGMTDINPSKMTVQGTGAVLHNLMELSSLDTGELQLLAAILR